MKIHNKFYVFELLFLPSIAAVPIAVGIISPEARMASNLDINTDILEKNNVNQIY